MRQNTSKEPLWNGLSAKLPATVRPIRSSVGWRFWHMPIPPLRDIDLCMPFADPRWPEFMAAAETYVVRGPESVVEGAWA